MKFSAIFEITCATKLQNPSLLSYSSLLFNPLSSFISHSALSPIQLSLLLSASHHKLLYSTQKQTPTTGQSTIKTRSFLAFSFPFFWGVGHPPTQHKFALTTRNAGHWSVSEMSSMHIENPETLADGSKNFDEDGRAKRTGL